MGATPRPEGNDRYSSTLPRTGSVAFVEDRMKSVRFLLLTVLPLIVCASASAQQSARVPKIGILNYWTIEQCSTALYGAFREGLRKLGYVEGHNVSIDCRSADGKFERFPALASQLIAANVDVIWMTDCGPQFQAARQATTSIPIVVAMCQEDLVDLRVIRSLAQPGGNITGLSKLSPEITAKRLELLKAMLPKLSRVGVLWQPEATRDHDWKALRTAANALNLTIESWEVHRVDDFEGAIREMVANHVEALMTFSDVITWINVKRLAELTAKYGLPATSPYRQFAEAGGLMSHGPNLMEMSRYSSVYVEKILKGASAAELPMEQSSSFETIINVKAAKSLRVIVPSGLKLAADEVIE
jgi:putative ABC transport system substrate-binding protein